MEFKDMGIKEAIEFNIMKTYFKCSMIGWGNNDNDEPIKKSSVYIALLLIDEMEHYNLPFKKDGYWIDINPMPSGDINMYIETRGNWFSWTVSEDDIVWCTRDKSGELKGKNMFLKFMDLYKKYVIKNIHKTYE